MLRFITGLATVGLAISGSSALAQAASSAYAVGVNQTVTAPNVANVNVSVGPLAATSGSTPPSYNNSATVASVNQTTASNSQGTSTGAQATANVQNGAVTIGSNVAGVPALFNLITSTIDSMSTANAGGVTGSSSITGASLTGSVFGSTTFASSLFASAAPNTVLFNALGLTITLNEQILSGTTGITTNAIDISFNNFVVGTGLKNGNIILGHTQASFSPAGAVPEPSTWAMMLVGFGAIGLAMRRSRRRKGAPMLAQIA
jgi:hypothetical protein